MPAWQTLTIADLLNAGHKDLVEKASRSAVALGQPDPVPALITATVNELRTQIGFRNADQVDSDPTKLAPNLCPLAVLKIIRALKKRLGLKLDDAERTYQKRLEQIKDGQWPVDLPLSPAPATNQEGPPTGYFGGAIKLTGTD